MPRFVKKNDNGNAYSTNGEQIPKGRIKGKVYSEPSDNHGSNKSGENRVKSRTQPPRMEGHYRRPQSGRKLQFHCQQAQGSPTGLISGFTNVKELYQKIADCFDFDPSEILFCTLNTHKIDMDNLLSAQLCLDDFIFVHRKGIKKEVQITKSESALGLTITDNGAGYAFIKRIKDESIIHREHQDHIQVGDHIEKIDGTSLVGCRHVKVAQFLKEIPVGTTFTLRLIEPLKDGFMSIGPRVGGPAKKSGKAYGSGKETLRFKKDGTASIESAPDANVEIAISKINALLESLLGINDVDLATQIYELALKVKDTYTFATLVDESDLEMFGFTNSFLIEVWGIVTDAKAGRLANIDNN